MIRGWERANLDGQVLCFGLGLSGAALGEAIAVAVHFHDADVVGQAIKQRTGDPSGLHVGLV